MTVTAGTTVALGGSVCDIYFLVTVVKKSRPMVESIFNADHSSVLPVLTHGELQCLSNAALKSRFRALQRMGGREPAWPHAEGPGGDAHPGIASKSSPHWRAAYRATKEVLEERRRLVLPRINQSAGSR